LLFPAVKTKKKRGKKKKKKGVWGAIVDPIRISFPAHKKTITGRITNSPRPNFSAIKIASEPLKEISKNSPRKDFARRKKKSESGRRKKKKKKKKKKQKKIFINIFI
jgi:hypothetical protein